MVQRRHLVVGAGPLGTALALRLASHGDRVQVITRGGVDPTHSKIEHIALDASNRPALAACAEGVDVLYNCANPGPYPVWEKRWPPLAASILGAAEDSGAVLVTLSNLYGYGRVNGPITRDSPLRASDHKGALRNRMWADALSAHQAGRVRVTEARSSDYLGPTAGVPSGVLARYATKTLKGQPAWVFSGPDQPHTWTAVDDIAATLAVLGADERAWGQAWLVPSNPPESIRTVLEQLSTRVGAPQPQLRQLPRWLVRAGGAVVPLLRELNGVLYQFDYPFVMDAAETTTTFGIEPTDWAVLLDETARAWADRAGHPRVTGPQVGR